MIHNESTKHQSYKALFSSCRQQNSAPMEEGLFTILYLGSLSVSFVSNPMALGDNDPDSRDTVCRYPSIVVIFIIICFIKTASSAIVMVCIKSL